MEKLVSVGEACERLGIHPNTLRRWDREGKIRIVRPQGGKRRVPESEINRILGAPRTIENESSSPDLMKSFLEFVFTNCKDDVSLVKKAVMIRDGHRCTRCGATKNLTVHPRDCTGAPEEIKTLCKSCAGFPENEENEKIELKNEKNELKDTLTKKEVSRMHLLEELSPSGLLQRTAFGDMISAAISLGRFTVEEIAARSRCPTQLSRVFCERMVQKGYLVEKNGTYELAVQVIA